MRIELCLADDMVGVAMEAVVKGARPGHGGDGAIHVVEASKGMRIRTGESL